MTSEFWESFLDKERSAFKRYGFAVLVSFLSLLLVYLLFSLEGGHPLTSLALMSVILSAIYGGKGPALLDTFITSIGVDYFFIEPYNQLHLSSISILRLLTYLTLGFLVANIVNSLSKTLLVLKDQKKQLQEEKKARENILGIVSHDLRSPLSSILMSTDLLIRSIDKGKQSASHSHLLFNIKDSSKRMNKLIEDLLDSVKIESGQFKLTKTKSEVSSILRAAIDESTKAASVKNIKLSLEAADPFQTIECDNSRIIQVLNNLIGNAIKFAPENSEVEVNALNSSEEICICIKDQGPGISEENLDKLFNRWQANETAHKGTGLGLFISKQIIDAHQGRIWVTSKEGQGSVFCFSLPKVTTSKDAFVNFTPKDQSEPLH
ncbi:MAG: ATP-binding protein [Bacteriovoracia bacterium]